MNLVQKVCGLENLTLLNPSNINPNEFQQKGKIETVILRKIGWGIYAIESSDEMQIPEIPNKGAYTLVYSQNGNNERIVAAIRFYEKINKNQPPLSHNF